MKIGILTWHYYPNFGSSLQAYALQETIRGLGIDVYIIDYRNPKITYTSIVKDRIRFLLSITIGQFVKRFSYPQIRYMGKYLRLTKRVYTEPDLKIVTKRFDIIVCGSDQIWAPNVYNPIYFASFFKGKKISYAASIGLPQIPKHLIPKYCEHLKDFSHIGVREEEGTILLRNTCNIDAEVVLDPTLLLPTEHYKRMERPISHINKPFVFCYFLNENHKYKECVIEYATRNKINIVGCSANAQDSSWIQVLSNVSACEFLWLIHHAETVMTDSYHGTIFSLLYHKRFYTFMRFSENDPIVQNSRIRQLNSYFNIDSQIQNPLEKIKAYNYDFETFENKLSILRNDSMLYLKNALGC